MIHQALVSILLLTIAIMDSQTQTHQETMESRIKSVVLALEKAASERNTAEIDKFLHEDYRVIANRFRGTAGTTIITKDRYLSMMAAGKIGGTSYDTEFLTISLYLHTAMVELLYKSSGVTAMHKYLFLVQDEYDEWKVVSDLPTVQE